MDLNGLEIGDTLELSPGLFSGVSDESVVLKLDDKDKDIFYFSVYYFDIFLENRKGILLSNGEMEWVE